MHRNRSVMWALLLIAIGVVLLLRQSGAIAEDVRIWPLVVLLIGAWLLVERVMFGEAFGAGWVWPLVLVAVGLVFLLQDTGAIDPDVTLWPVILIAVGIGLMLSAMPSGRRAAEPVRDGVPLEGASSARVEIRHGAGRLEVRSTTDPALLLDGTFSNPASKDVRRVGSRLEVRLRHAGGMPWSWGRGAPLDWTVGLSRRVPLELEVDAGANQAHLDLADLTITELRVNTGASDTTIVVPATGRTTARLKAGAASLKVRVPDRTAARIVIRGGLSGTNVDTMRFGPLLGGFQSPGYDEATDRVDLEIEAGAASVEVR